MKYIAVLYLLIYLPGLLGNSSIFRCPLYRQYFQKILGFRPAINTLNDSFLYKATPNVSNYIDNYAINNKYIPLPQDLPRLAINLDCWLKCKEDIECTGYVLYFNATVCYGFTRNDQSRRHLTLLMNDSLVQDNSAVYFEKICLNNVPAINKAKLWLFTKIPGSNLVYQGRKTLPMLVGRSRCAEECLHEKEFQCLSASYIASHRNNFVRFDQNGHSDESDQLGTCILSAKDKSVQPDAFRVSSIDEEYIENQCADRGTENHSCSYEVHKNSRLIYAEVEYKNITQNDCKEKCVLETRFFCQGISHFDSRTGLINTRCLLHSEDVISLGPRTLITDLHYTYMRRVRCLNVTVVCSKTEMTINYSPYDSFIGRLYVSSHSEERSSAGKGYQPVILNLPIGNEVYEKRSGIIRAYQVEDHSSINRTLLSTHIVIQTNPIVQTQGDRLIKVGCIIDNNMHENGTIGDIALGSSLLISHRNPTNDGTQILNSTGTAPRVTMRVVDMAQYTQINDVALGQNLELQISLDPPDSLYDIRAVQLIARSDTGHSSIMLLDKRGCPTDQTVFPALEKLHTNSTHLLFGRFHAFKFAGSSFVNFEVIIQFCMHECQPINCGQGVRSNGRRRRRSISNELNYNDDVWLQPEATILAGKNLTYHRMAYDVRQNQSVSIDNPYRVETNSVVSQQVLGSIAQEIIDANVAETSHGQFTNNKRVLKELEEVPLQFQLNVRVPEVADSESLIYGENNQILVSGIDRFTAENMVCINQTLFILLLLLWIILQTILLASCCIMIRRYKRLGNGDDDRTSLQKIHQNLEYENRRVHWADQGRSHVMMFT